MLVFFISVFLFVFKWWFFFSPITGEAVFQIQCYTDQNAALLRLKLQTVDENSLQLADVVRSLYRDAHPAGRAWKFPLWGVGGVIVRLADVFIVGILEATLGTLKRLVHVQVLGREAVVVLDLSGNDVETMFRPWAVTGAVTGAVAGAVRH